MEEVQSITELPTKPDGVYRLATDSYCVYVVVGGAYTIIPNAVYDMILKQARYVDVLALKNAGFATGDLLLLRKEGLI